MGAGHLKLGHSIDPKLVERLDAWRETQPVSPARTQVMITALKKFLDKHEDQDKGRKK